MILGIIHLLGKEDLSFFYSGFQGFIFNIIFFIAIGLIFFANPSRPIRSKKTIILFCIGTILFIAGMIVVETIGLGSISLSLIIIGMMIVIVSDFLMGDFNIKN